MRLPIKARHLPARLAVGAFILNSGCTKLGADAETAQGTHGMAAGAYPFLNKTDPQKFTRALATGEVLLGGALLAPVVPTALAGAGLTGFSAGLLGLYLRTPGMRQEGNIRPTEQGTPLAKDVWLLGIGLSFVVDSVVNKKANGRCCR